MRKPAAEWKSGNFRELTFREIKVTDIPELFRVRVATWENENGAEELEALGITRTSVAAMLDAGSHRGWLCENESGEAVGFSMGDRTNGEMWVIAVLPDYEARGIGAKLLTLVENWLWSEGWEEIWLTTFTGDDQRAVGFYQRQGWFDAEIGELRLMKKSKSNK